jgi:hypothetical protein
MKILFMYKLHFLISVDYTGSSSYIRIHKQVSARISICPSVETICLWMRPYTSQTSIGKGVVTNWTTGFRFPTRIDIFSSPVSYSWMSGVKLLVEEADNSPETCSVVKNTWSDPCKSKYDSSYCSNRTVPFIWFHYI